MIALWSLGLTKEVIIVSVLHEASELLVNSGFLGVCHGKVLVLADHPVSQAGVLHRLVLGVLHALALLEGHVELLVGDEELGSDILTRVNDLLGMRTNTRGRMSKDGRSESMNDWSQGIKYHTCLGKKSEILLQWKTLKYDNVTIFWSC